MKGRWRITILVNRIEEAILNRPTKFDQDPLCYLRDHGYREDDAPEWYLRSRDTGRVDVCKLAAPFLVWLWRYVKPVLRELAADPKATRALLDRLPPRASFPQQEPPEYAIDEKAQNEFSKTFHVPLVDLWMLWRHWHKISGLPEIPAPEYPGGKCPASAHRKTCKHKSITEWLSNDNRSARCAAGAKCPRDFESWLPVRRWSGLMFAGVCTAQAVEWVCEGMASLERALLAGDKGAGRSGKRTAILASVVPQLRRNRKKRPGIVDGEVLTSCRRRCCLCFGLKKDASEKAGQIAHLDGDPSNNDKGNLVYLCLEHHDRYDTRTSQSKGLTIEEVRHYRDKLNRYLETHLGD